MGKAIHVLRAGPKSQDKTERDCVKLAAATRALMQTMERKNQKFSFFAIRIYRSGSESEIQFG
jgi:hypothetical protein